jgi:acyl carrier protein
MESVENRIKRILEMLLGVDQEGIENNEKLKDDLFADSLDLVEIIMEIEGEFDIEILDDEIDETIDYTVQYVIDLVENKLFG